jgi:putative flippase GtrA
MRAWRYFGVSLIALGADMAAFMALLGLGAAVASALGYGLGVGVHWFLSSRGVFDAATHGAARLRQKGLFLGSALLGLGLTTGIVGALAALGTDPRAAKIIAISASFVATYALRARIVFAR